LILQHNALRINHFFESPKPATMAASRPARKRSGSDNAQ
jgi:hypothetical protein